MSRRRYFDKEYPNRKDWVRPYYKEAQRVDTSCRCHGGCEYCKNNRLFGLDTKRRLAADEEIDEFFNELTD